MSLQYEKSEEEEPQVTPEEFLNEQKSAIRQRSKWFLAAGFLIGTYLLFEFLSGSITVQELFRSVFFILALFGLVGGLWGIYYANKLTLKDLIPSSEAIDFLRQGQLIKPFFSYILVGAIVLVTIVELLTENVASIFDVGEQSAAIGGLVKPLVWRGEYWRLLTAATLHGIFPLHLYFNAQALYGFGSLIESLANRAHLAIVFLLAVIGGGLLSLFFMPDITSIGASGGIMGLIGYLAIYGYRRKRQLPPDFLKSMLINIGFIVAFGIVGFRIVDNFAHLGGLLTGAIYGYFQIPKDFDKNPRAVSTTIELFGFVALGIFLSACILTILLISKIIHL